MENLWSWMKREVYKKRPKNNTELEAGILNVWEGLRQSISKTILHIYDSCLDQCIANVGGRTKILTAQTFVIGLTLAQFLDIAIE